MRLLSFAWLLFTTACLFGNYDEAMNETLRFAKGHREFQDLYFKQNEQSFIRLIREGQSPKTLFIGCSDSRIVPDLILTTRPGDLFVIRTAGNFVPDFEASSWGDGVSASVQYAVQYLGVKHIIVCGHSHCGAVRGLFQDLNPEQLGILKKWMRFGEPAKKLTLQTVGKSASQEEIFQVTEHLSVLYQLEHLLSFPFIAKRVEEGALQLHGWYYRIETGEVEYYDPTSFKFISLSTLRS